MSAVQVQWTLIEIGLWGGTVIPFLFGVQYTLIARWWRKPTGQTIMALDVCIFALRFRCLLKVMIWHSRHYAVLGHFDWVTAVVEIAVPAVILYRMAAFETIRRRKLRDLAEARARALIYSGVPRPRFPGQHNDRPVGA